MLYWVMKTEESVPAVMVAANAHRMRQWLSLTMQQKRRVLQSAFFALFLTAPALNVFRFDLNETQLWVLGQRWSLGIDGFIRGNATATQTALHIIVWGIVPLLTGVAIFLSIAYRYGRLYCGWLCPHFSAVEILNDLLHRACGKLSIWDASATIQKDQTPKVIWWPVFVVTSCMFAFLWSITLLTYLLPPSEIWGNFLHAQLTLNQTRFLVVGTVVLTLEFTLARHLFCRFGCAVGLFQSLVWMANDKGLVMAFDRQRAKECKTCDAPLGSACDRVCPMRLSPRNIKRMMFSCVQCGKCTSACDASQAIQKRTASLTWVTGLDAVRENLRQKVH